ncbi:baseplate J/gp47 family protein, partial [Paracoccus sp. PXZ]
RARVSTAVARDLIPESIRNPARARCVTADDYARAAEDIPGVARAAAKPLGGVFNTILVLCAPDQGDRLDATTAAAVHAHLDALRMAGREHVLGAPDYVALDLHLVICPRGGTGAAAIRRAV